MFVLIFGTVCLLHRLYRGVFLYTGDSVFVQVILGTVCTGYTGNSVFVQVILGTVCTGYTGDGVCTNYIDNMGTLP